MAGNESGASRVGEAAAGDQAEVAAILDVMQQAASAAVQGSPAGVTGTFAAQGDVTSPDSIWSLAAVAAAPTC